MPPTVCGGSSIDLVGLVMAPYITLVCVVALL